MKNEAPLWNPAHWSHEKVRRYTRRVFRRAAADCEYLLGPHQGRLEIAMMMASLLSAESLAALRAAGVPVIGDTTPRDTPPVV